MSAFERLLAIADEETLDLARAMIGKPELALLLCFLRRKRSKTPLRFFRQHRSRSPGNFPKWRDRQGRKLRYLRTTGVGRLSVTRFTCGAEASHK